MSFCSKAYYNMLANLVKNREVDIVKEQIENDCITYRVVQDQDHTVQMLMNHQ